MPILIAVLLLSQAAIEPEPLTTIVTEEKVGSIEIPDEIGYPVSRYLICQTMSKGTPLYADGKLITPSVAKGADCSAVRKKAIEDSDKILDRMGMSKKERMALIEKTLADADKFNDISGENDGLVPAVKSE